MKIAEALCAAADHIERHPKSYNFNVASVCDETTGCMLGHFGRLAGLPLGLSVETLSWAVLGKGSQDFYHEICAAAGSRCNENVVCDAHIVPGAMRKVAKKYEGIPQEVREIFDARVNATPFAALSGLFFEHLRCQAQAARATRSTAGMGGVSA